MIVWQLNESPVLSHLRLVAHSALRPGREMLLAIERPENPQKVHDDSLQNQLLKNELQRRQLILENAQLRQRVKAARTTQPFTQIIGRDLVDYVAVKARVLSRSGMSQSLKHLIVDAGKSQGLRESELVIRTDGMIVDKGTDHGLSPGQKVAAGAVVTGRLKRVTRWVSEVEPVTSPDFSAAVQLLNRSAQESGFGEHGILVGSGNGQCRITGVPYTAVVAVGDEVYSASLNGVQGPRLFYGTVVSAEFQGGGQWDILVKPAGSEAMDEVAVIRQRLDSERVSGYSTTERRENRS